MRRRRKNLDNFTRTSLRNCLIERLELTNEKLEKRFGVSRTTIWREERELLGKPVSRGTTKRNVSNKREKLTTAQIIQFADHIGRAQ